MSFPSIYFDNNASTLLDPSIAQQMHELSLSCFGNPSSIHWAGRAAKKVLNIAREKIAQMIHCSEHEIIFTSGGTESIHLAIQGLWVTEDQKRRAILSSQLEHQATLKHLEFLQKKGANLKWLSHNEQGVWEKQSFENLLNEELAFVTLMAANNELGNKNSFDQIAALCVERSIPFHLDAVQWVGKEKINLSQVPVTCLSFSAHKFHGPKGVAALFVRKGCKIQAQQLGGSQEYSLRAGTQNVIACYGMALALEKAMNELEKTQQHLKGLQNKLWEGIKHLCPKAKWVGDTENKLENTLNIYFPTYEAEDLLMKLDMQGVAVSTGSACESGSIDPSHVLLALGLREKEAKSCLRFSLSRFNKEEEIDQFLKIFSNLLK